MRWKIDFSDIYIEEKDTEWESSCPSPSRTLSHWIYIAP